MNQEKPSLESDAGMPEKILGQNDSVENESEHIVATNTPKNPEASVPANLPIAAEAQVDIDVDSEMKKSREREVSRERRPGEHGEMFGIGKKNLAVLRQIKKDITHESPHAYESSHEHRENKSPAQEMPVKEVSAMRPSFQEEKRIRQEEVRTQSRKNLSGLVSAYATDETVKLNQQDMKSVRLPYGSPAFPKQLDAYKPREGARTEATEETTRIKEDVKERRASRFRPHEAGKLAAAVLEYNGPMISFEKPAQSLKEVEQKIYEARNLLKHVIDSGGTEGMDTAERALAEVLEKLRAEKERLTRLAEAEKKKEEARLKALEEEEKKKVEGAARALRDTKNILKSADSVGGKIAPESALNIDDESIKHISEPPVGNSGVMLAEFSPDILEAMKERVKMLAGGELPKNWDSEWQKLSGKPANELLDEMDFDTDSPLSYLQKYLEEISKTSGMPLEKTGARDRAETVGEYIGRISKK